jgi:glycosyltransferase involved in cell wall biosynthesis
MFISWGVPENRRFYVPNAIDTDYFIRSRDQRQARNLLGIQPTGDFLIGALGRLAPEKGFDRLIKAVHRLRNSGLMFDLWIAGEGGMRNELQSMISAMGLEDSVRLLGHQKDPRLFLESLDGFVLSSLREGLPNVILEALSMGTPVVSTKVAGVPGVITHREEGLLIDVDDTDAMVASIAELAQSGFLRENLIKKGRQLMVDRFNFSDRMRKVCDVYNTLLK